MRFHLLRCLARAIARNGVKFVCGLAPGGEVVYDIARDAWEDYRKGQPGAASKGDDLRTEVQALASAPPDQVAQEAQAAAQAEAPGLTPEAQQAVAAYLTQVPAAIRRSLRRPSDPTGTTVPLSLPLSQPEELARLLPPRPPRFKPGDRPLPGVAWVLEEPLGVGGFGEVWKARHAHLRSKPPVALKFCLDAQAALSLRNEAGVLDRVMQHGRHPGIVPLLQAYLDAEPPCLEYEYVEGSDLAGLVRELHAQGQLTADVSNGLILQLAEIVASAHRADPAIVHDDLKLANVLARRGEGRPFDLYVTDFGIGGLAAARAIQDTKLPAQPSRPTLLTEAVRGAYTPLYAPPEQMLRKRGEPPDPRDDVHALGVIWYQLLTGNLEMLAVPTDWRDEVLERGLSEGLTQLLASCMASKAEKRPASAAALVERLGALLSAKATTGARSEEAARRQRQEQEEAQRRQQAVERERQRQAEETRRREEEVRRQQAAVQELERRQREASEREQQVRAQEEERRQREQRAAAARRRRRLVRGGVVVLVVGLAVWGLYRVGSVVVDWFRPLATCTATLTGHTGAVHSVAFSPDGRTLASGSGDNTIKLWDVTTGQEKATLKGHGGDVSSVAFSPDGRTLASGSVDRTIKLWDMTTGQEKATLKGYTDWVQSVAFSPDGRALASGSLPGGGEDTIKLWDVTTGKEKASFKGGWFVTFSPDGKTLASWGGPRAAERT